MHLEAGGLLGFLWIHWNRKVPHGSALLHHSSWKCELWSIWFWSCQSLWQGFYWLQLNWDWRKKWDNWSLQEIKSIMLCQTTYHNAVAKPSLEYSIFIMMPTSINYNVSVWSALKVVFEILKALQNSLSFLKLPAVRRIYYPQLISNTVCSFK